MFSAANFGKRFDPEKFINEYIKWSFLLLFCQAGFSYKLSKTVDEADIRTNAFEASLRTPLPYMSRIDFRGNIELEDFVYRGNASIQTTDTVLAVAGSYQVRRQYF